jgi:hypothetical protein
MRLKYGFLSMIVGLTLVMAIGVTAQSNTATCPTLVQESFTATEFLCESVPDGQVCLGNGVVTTTPLEGASVQLADPGDLATLADINRLAAQTINTESQAFTSITAKLDASSPNGDPQIVDMLIFGDTVISNALEQSAASPSGGIFAGTVEAAGGVIVRQDATINSNNIWQLLNGESIQAIGRSSDNQWVRILIPSPNGGAGWVFGQFVSIEGGRELLPYQTNASPVPEASAAQTQVSLKSMQAFRMESLLTDPGCTDTPDSGIMLQSPTLDTRAVVEVNGVELRIRGSVYITAQVADKMTIYNLEGETAVIVDDNRVDMTQATMTEVPLDASLAPTGAPSDATPYSQDVANLLVFLPIRLLSRNFEIAVVDPSLTVDTSTTDTTTDTSDTSQPEEQEAPPPPAATETPPEETVNPEECPTLVQESYTATEFLCEAIGANTACLGNAGADMVTTTAREGVTDFTFAVSGDMVNTTDIDTLSMRVFDDPDNIWNSVAMTLDAKTTTGATAQATILVLGEVELENKGEDAPALDTTDTATDTTTTAPPPAVPTTDTTQSTETDTTTATDSGVPATIQSPGGIIVRPEPRVDSATVGQLQDGDAVIALGRSVDQQWVQVQNEEGVTGWVFVQFVAIEGGANTLPIIDPNAEPSTDTAAAPPPATNQSAPPPPATNTTTTRGDVPEFTSMQAFEFSSTGIPSDCSETHSSGLMIQSPDDMDGNLILMINGIRFEINGTTYLSASLNENTNVIGLEGEITITSQDTSQTIEAGQQASVQMTNGLEVDSPPSIPGEYSFKNAQRFLFLPIRLLPRAFEVVVPPEPAGSGDTQETNTGDNTLSTDTSSDDGLVNIGGTTVDFNADCVMSAGDRARNLRADAGPGFDVINTLQPGQTIEAKTQKRGTDQVYWYETAKGWIRSDAGIPTDDCKNLPLYGVIYDTTSSGGNVAAVAPVAPLPPAQPTATPPPPVVSDGYGNVCAVPGFSVAEELRASGQTYVEFGGVWTGQAGQSVTFSAEVPYYRPELLNILTFVNEDGSDWLGSLDGTSFTINFDSTRRFRVRVAALLGDYVTLRVSC